MNNLDLWNRVKTIDKKYTKDVKKGALTLTSYNQHSVIELATREFGMFGRGWGYKIETERFDEGCIITHQVKLENGDIQPEVKEITHTLLVSFWYVFEGEKYECPPQPGHTPYIMATKYGPKSDDEYYKKTLTDALKRSLSMLGFAADIHLGLMEDQHYQAILESEKEMQEQSRRPELINNFTEELDRKIDLINAQSQPHSVQAVAQAARSFIEKTCRSLNIKPDNYLSKLTDAYENKKQQLTNKEK